MQLLILEGQHNRFEVKYQLLGLRIDSMATNYWELVPLYGSRTPNCWDSWSKFMKNRTRSWILYSFCWLPIVGSFLLIYRNPFWTFIHSLLTNRTKVHVSRILGPSLSWSIFQFLGCGQPHNLIIVVVIVVVSQIIINCNVKSIFSLYHTCFRQSSDCHFVHLCASYTEGFCSCVDSKIVQFEQNGNVIWIFFFFSSNLFKHFSNFLNIYNDFFSTHRNIQVMKCSVGNWY